MRVATFNVLHGVAVRDGAAATAGDRPPGAGSGLLGAAVAELAADVLGLQEVDVAQPRSGGRHQVRDAAEAMAAEHWRFAPAVRGTPGEHHGRWQAPGRYDAARAAAGEPTDALYGVGLVCRLPVLQWRTTVFAPAPASLPLLVPGAPRPRLMWVRDEPRAAIAAVVQGPAGPLTVATVHLSFVPGWNVRQLRRLRAWLADLPRPLVLLGDLNLPGPLPRRITGWTPLVRAATYPVTGPRVQFDHVLADGVGPAVVAGARATVHRLPVSDHAAVTVDVQL